MGQEKVQAFYQSWAAMWSHSWQMQMQMAQTLTHAGMAMATGGSPAKAMAIMNRIPAASTGLLAAGLKPVHSAAVANARRLGRRKK